ncbi:hypothetical protein GCM10010466_17540 [Planomonospora alba]|uniref:Peptidase S8/S53 domain-containing protein n=1 Tax=Planomonospora alba TaxID=161354 RepID=A0ABP6MV71_9ACTN
MPATARLLGALAAVTVTAAAVTAGVTARTSASPDDGPAAAPAAASTAASAASPSASPAPAGRPDASGAGTRASERTDSPAPRRTSPAPAVEDWKPREPVGLTGPVSEVLAGAPERGPVRVVTLTSDAAGRPQVHVTVAEDRRKAAGAVEDARAVPGALAVVVDSKATAADTGAADTNTADTSTTAADTPSDPADDAPSSGDTASQDATAPPAEDTSPQDATGTVPEATGAAGTGAAGTGAAGTGAAETTAAAPGTAVSASAAKVNDALRSRQWPLDRLSAESTWASATGAGQTVAVVDSGVDGSHPDLADAVLPGVDLVRGTGDGHYDPDGHGTHVAGIIAAKAGDGVGVAGLAPGAKILPVRVLDESGSGWTSDIADGIFYAADHGATVINLSLGGPGADPIMGAAVDYALARDVVVVAAAGNSGQSCTQVPYPMPGENCGNPVSYPAAFRGVVGVAATTSADARAVFSQYGSYVDLAAPGVDVLSTVPARRYASMSGTSMASPYAAAAAALVRARFPEASAGQVTARLTGTALDLGAAGRDSLYGAGRIRPLAAVADSGTPFPPDATATGLALSASKVTAGQSVRATVTVRTAVGAGISGTARLCSRRTTASAYRCATVPVRSGTGTAWLRADAGTYAYARFTGTATAAASTSRTARVGARPKVVVRGGEKKVTLRVYQPQRQRVSVQRYRKGKWRTVKRVTAARASAYTVRRLPRGTYRIVVPATRDLLAVTSGKVRVR